MAATEAVGRIVLAVLIAFVSLTACSEEDRRAWVSILPLPSDDADTLATRSLTGEIRVAPDSAAVLIGSDTLFTRSRVPGAGPGGEPLSESPIVAIFPSPDSTDIAFVSGAERSVVGVWSRRRQLAGIAEEYPGGGADGLTWSPDGRYLAHRGSGPDGATRAGVFDVAAFRPATHPVLAWLGREGRSAWPQGWIDAGRLRLLVAPGREMEGGLAYSWEIAGGALMLESHLAPLAERAPPGSSLEPGGAFSLDLLGDAAPETVALFRSAEGIPGALVMESRGGGFRVTPSMPLIRASALGLEDWESVERGAALYQVATLGGATALLLDLPASTTLRTVGLFQAATGGGLEPMILTGDGEDRPAIFFDGIFGDVTSQLGLVDLDEDGSLEVVSAIGRAAPTLEPGIEWTVTPYRARADGRLVPAPELRESALETVRRAAGQS